MPNPQNLKPWKPGQSGNPAGKKKGTPNRATILQRYMDAADQYGTSAAYSLLKDHITIEQGLDYALVHRALNDDQRAYKMVMDMVYGKNRKDHSAWHSDPE